MLIPFCSPHTLKINRLQAEIVTNLLSTRHSPTFHKVKTFPISGILVTDTPAWNPLFDIAITTLALTQ